MCVCVEAYIGFNVSVCVCVIDFMTCLVRVSVFEKKAESGI